MDSSGSGPTPEKQLLKLIEQPQGGEVGQTPAAAPAAAVAPSPAVATGRARSMRGGPAGLRRSRKGLSGIKGVNKALGVVAALLGLFLTWDVMVSFGDRGPDRDLVAEGPELPMDPPDIPDIPEIFEVRKNPFAYKEQEVEVKAPEIDREQIKRDKMQQIIDTLKYKGYDVVGPNDEIIATIKDEAGVRHKLKAGDEIPGTTMKILTVYRDRIKVNYLGMDGEIRMQD